MFHPTLRAVPLALALAFSTPTIQAESATPAPAAATYTIAVASQSLGSALNEVARQARLQLLVSPALVDGKTAPAVSGTMTAHQAIERVLAGSGLRADFDGTSVIVRQGGSAKGESLPEVSVVADAERSAASEGTGSYAVHATSIMKGVSSLKEIPQTVSVVTRQNIEENNLMTLVDVMRSAPGITLNQTSSLTNRYMSRGFEVNNYRVDGGLAIDNVFSTDDMVFYDRIEVLRGADGLYGGAGEPGGTINFVRKKPTRELQISGGMQVGSWGYKRAEIDVGGPINEAGSLRARGVVAHDENNFFYDVAKAKNTRAYGVIEADLTRDTMLTAGLSYIDTTTSEQGYGLPSAANGSELNLPRSIYLSGADDVSHYKNLRLFSSLQTKLNPDWAVKLSVEYQRLTGDTANYYFNGFINPVTGLGLSGDPSLQKIGNYSRSADLSLTGKFDAFGRRHDLVVGTNWIRSSNAYDIFAESSPSIGSIYSFNPYDYRMPSNMPQTEDGGQVDEQSGIYGSVRLHLADPLHVILGGRLGSFKSKWHSDAFENGAITDRSQTDYSDSRIFTPYFGFTYDLNKTWTLYGSIAETFKSQSNYRSASGAPLTPVRGRNYELGAKGEHFGGKMQSMFAVYEIHRDNAAVEDGPTTTAADGSTCCYVASGKIISQGFDAEVSGEVARGVQLQASYNYNYNRNQKSTLSRFDTLTPKNMVKIYGSYQLPEFSGRLKLGGGVDMRSASYRIGRNVQRTQGAYAIWNAFASYKIDEKWSLALNVNNLFDKTYYSTIGYAWYGNFYGAPRSVMLSLRGSL